LDAGYHLSFARDTRKSAAEFPVFIWHRTYTLQKKNPVNCMDDLTVEEIIAFHNEVMMTDGGDTRLLSEATLYQMVFSVNRIEGVYERAALAFFTLVAYPAFREGNGRTAGLVAERILSANGYTLEENDDEITTLVQGIASFTVEQEDVEAWLRSRYKKSSILHSPH
jgi:death-on-curing family protein